MNRLLFALNVITLIVLVVFMRRYASEAAELRTWAYGDETVLPASGIHVVPDDTRWKQRWLVDFGADMVDDVAADPGSIVRLDPETPVALEWRSKSTLQVTPLKALTRATTYALRFDDEVKSRDGRRLPEGLDLTLETPRPRLLALTVVDDEEGAGEGVLGGSGESHPSLLARFDVPVAAGTLRDALQVIGDGESLPVRVEDTGTVGEHTLAIRFPREQVLPRTVTVRLDKSLRARVGDLSLGEDVIREVALKEELRLLGVKTDEHGVDLEFNRGVSLPEVGYLTLRPAVPFQVVRRSSGLRLLARLTPGQATRVTLAKGFPGKGPRRLAEQVTRTTWMADRRPSLSFADSGQVLSSRARAEIPVTGVNVQRLEVTVRSVYSNNLVRLAQSGSWYPPSTVCGPERKKEIVVAAPRNAEFTERVDISDLLDGNARGVHHVVVEDLDNNAYRLSRLIQVTDLGVSVRATDDVVAVHCSELAQGKDVARATVEVLTPTNQLLCSGMTGANGVALLRFERPSDDMRPFLVKVTRGQDLAYVDVKRFGVELATDAFGGRARAEGIEAWVQGDRGLVRPGGTLRAHAVVRDLAGKAPAGRTLIARWRDPGGVVHAENEVEVPVSGLLGLELATHGDAVSGPWRVELVDTADREERVVGRTSLRVESFVPARIEAEVLPLEDLTLGKEGSVEVVGRWLEGAPASGLVATVNVRFDHGSWKPAGFEEFHFDAPAKGAPPGARRPIRAVLGGDGRVRVRFPVPAEAAETQTLNARVSVALKDPSGRVVRAGLTRPVLRPDHHVGVRAARDGTAAVVALDRQGRLVDVEGPVTLVLEKRRWETRWRRRANGNYGYETRVISEVVDTRDVTLSGGRGSARFARPIDPDAWYAVVATHGTARTEARIGDRARRPDRLRVAGPGAPVAAGEPFELQIDSPIAGRAFITVEGRTVLAHRVASVGKGRTRVPLTFRDDPIGPNVHVAVTVRRPQARRSPVAGPAWIVGGTSVAVDRSDRHVDVTVDAPEKVAPKSVLNVDIHAPGATEAVVAVVDDGILGLSGHPEPDPFGWFTARRRCTTVGADNGRKLMMSARFEAGVLVGGGDGAGLGGVAARLRGTTSSLIATLVLSRRVTLDSEGRARAALRLPEYEGRVRVAVIACGSVVMGAASRDVTVAGPLGLRIAMPRMLASADRSRATVTVMNRTGEAAACSLSAEAFGGLAVAPFGSDVQLPAGATRHVDVPFVANEVDAAAGLKVVATMGTLRREVVGRVVVRPPALYAEDRIGVVAAGQARIVVPDGWAGAVKARIVAHEEPDAALLPALESMLRYPYGCVEQTTSRCRALLACARMLPRFYDGAESGEARALLQSGIDRLLAMQTRRGGYGWWRGGEEQPFLTMHVLDLFVDAAAAGIKIPEGSLRRLTDRAWTLMQRSSDGAIRSYGAEVLSRAGRPAGPWVARLAEAEAGIEERSHLAMALARIGAKQVAVDVLEGKASEASEQEAEPEVESGGMLRSTIRARALELKARLVVTPTHPRIPILAKELSDALVRPDRRTTQERGRAIDALATWYATQQAGAGFSNGSVTVAGKRHELVASKPIELEVESGDVFEFACEGRLYGMIDLRGFRGATTPGTGGAGVTLRREVVDVATGKPAGVFERGRLYEVRLSGVCDEPVENIAITDILPGGFEPETSSGAVPHRAGVLRPSRVEARDDRVLLFYTGRLERKFAFRYRMRAVFPGVYVKPPSALEALYEPGRRVELAGGTTVEVK